MATQKLMALNVSKERAASTHSGYPVLILILLSIGAIIYSIVRLIDGDAGALTFTLLIGGTLLMGLLAAGFYMLQPNQAAVITLFGDYRGSDRSTGLRWVWPWMLRPKVSIRIHNFTSDRIKVNDLRGNPIEIAANVVWRVTDTAQAMFDVVDYKEFIKARSKARFERSARNIPMTISSTKR